MDKASNIGVENDEKDEDVGEVNREGSKGEVDSAEDKNNTREVKKRKSGEVVVYADQ